MATGLVQIVETFDGILLDDGISMQPCFDSNEQDDKGATGQDKFDRFHGLNSVEGQFSLFVQCFDPPYCRNDQHEDWGEKANQAKNEGE